jgi:hypothetical protein
MSAVQNFLPLSGSLLMGALADGIRLRTGISQDALRIRIGFI